MSTSVAIKQSQLQNWCLIIKDRKESGLSVPDYCKQHNITKHQYYYWYAKVKKELYSQNSFVEISAGPEKSRSEQPASNSNDMIEINSGTISIKIPLHTSKEVLARIIEVAAHAQ